jgi:hypothetical protein
VYTDVTPDTTLKCSSAPYTSTYNLDLNNDGTNDFSIVVSKTVAPLGKTNKYVTVTPLNGNATLGTVKNSGDVIEGILPG